MAFDPPGEGGTRTMAKMLAGSLLRTFFDGDIVIFRNSPVPIFLVERAGLREVYVETPPHGHGALAGFAWCAKYQVRHLLDVRGYDKVLFLDADCLTLRNIDHLLNADFDVAYQWENGLKLDLPQFNCFLTEAERALPVEGVNSGQLAVRANLYQEVMTEWERIDQGPTVLPRHCSDQGSWNKLLLTNPQWRKRPFEPGEVMFPTHVQTKYTDYKQAALLHFLGASNVDKIHFMFGLYMATFYGDASGTFLKLLEV